LGTIPVKNLPEKDFTKNRTNLFWTKTHRTDLFSTKTGLILYRNAQDRLILDKTGQTILDKNKTKLFWTKTGQTYN
jgi:hypothetical protein